MTRYVKHKNGLSIGSSNHFGFIRGEELTTFSAILWAEDYRLDNYTSANVLYTPAQQILWHQPSCSLEDEDELPPLRLSSHIAYWLKNNVSPRGEKWDYRDKPESRSDCIFFTRRSDAVKLSRHINGFLLAGLKFGN